mgnify:CR=1 FL=1
MNFFHLAALFLALTLTLFGAAFLVVEIWVIIWGHYKGAPFIRSPRKKIDAMFELAGVKAGETVVDLGSGDGTLVIEAAKRGAKAVGVEINPLLVWYSRRKIKKAGLQERAQIVKCDLRNYPLHDTDVIFLYLLSGTLEGLREKLSGELKSGARIISNSFPLSEQRVIMEKDGVFLYHHGG